MFKSLKEIASQLDLIRLGINDLAQALKDWDAARTEESGGIVKAKDVKPGWRVDGREIVAVTDHCGQTRLYFSISKTDVLVLYSDALVLIDKEEQQ